MSEFSVELESISARSFFGDSPVADPELGKRLGSPVWVFVSFLIVWLALAPSVLLWTSRAGVFGLAVGLLVAYVVLLVARHGWSRTGRGYLRDRLLARGPFGRLPARTGEAAPRGVDQYRVCRYATT